MHTDSFRYLSFANNPNNSAKINMSSNLNENSNYKVVKNSKIKRSRSLSKKSNKSITKSKKRSGNLSPNSKPKKLKKMKSIDSEKSKLTKNQSCALINNRYFVKVTTRAKFKHSREKNRSKNMSKYIPESENVTSKQKAQFSYSRNSIKFNNKM